MSEPDAFSATTEETDSRHPRIDQKDLPDTFQPVNRQIAKTDALQRRESRRKRRIGHMRRRKPVHGARREQKHPRTKDERESERIDLPRRHHVVESRTHPCRQRRTERQRQPHPDGIAHERRKRAPHQHAVEAPESLLAVLGRKAEQIPRHRGDGHAQQGVKPLAGEADGLVKRVGRLHAAYDGERARDPRARVCGHAADEADHDARQKRAGQGQAAGGLARHCLGFDKLHRERHGDGQHDGRQCLHDCHFSSFL